MAEVAGARNPWVNSESEHTSRAELNCSDLLLSESMVIDGEELRFSAPQTPQSNTEPEWKLGFGERVFSAAGAAVLSAIIVNPLDVAKTRLQAQAAGVAYSHPLSNIISRMAFFGPNMMFADLRCSPSCSRAGVHGTVSICPPDCFQYKGTLDVFYKIIRQEGFSRLWRGTNAGLALAVPTVGIYLPCYDIFRNWMEDFTSQNIPGVTPYVPLVAGSFARSLACATCYPIELARTRMQVVLCATQWYACCRNVYISQIGRYRACSGYIFMKIENAIPDFFSLIFDLFKAFKATESVKPPGVLKTLLEVLSHVKSKQNVQNDLRGYRVLWTGMGAQLARDVPFSAICWSTLEPIRRRLLGLIGEESSAISVLGANFSAGFVAGSLAAAATCPLDVAKTRRQIENDPVRALHMTTRRMLGEIWRDGGMKALFTGVGPRVGRAGPSVGIVVSFYEVVKHVLHQRYAAT